MEFFWVTSQLERWFSNQIVLAVRVEVTRVRMRSGTGMKGVDVRLVYLSVDRERVFPVDKRVMKDELHPAVVYIT